ncbi:MAG: endonuclease III [Clostridia bacterium]|nr:endonuclease III [Clostridia bacterium]
MIKKIIEALEKEYPDATCSLNFSNPLELMVAVILSAQSTDAMINKITPRLFSELKTAEDYANCDLKHLEELVKSSGFYHNKAKNIKENCKMLVEKFNGEVPHTMEELTSLPGVGRKTANVVLLNAFDICEGIAVDTHAKRISNRLGLSDSDDPLKIEKDLLQKIPKQDWSKMNHLFVYHGRATCTASKPKCDICCVNRYCEKNGVPN